MKMRKMLFTSVLVVVLLVSGCGQKKTDTAGQSFGSIDQTTIASSVPSATPAPSTQPVSSASPDKAVPSASPKPETEAVETTAVKETQPTPLPTPKVSELPKAVQSAPPQADAANVKADVTPSPSMQPKPTAGTEPSKAVKPSTPSSNEINWDQFFDNEKQDTPSDRFWDMSGKTVQIKGFMGEVLSFDKHWFLLIPKPGAECPFDNGDETYWNKIMIVFVPDDVKLRYTSGPLLITGKLDVGVKLDESGYKTMFRLYDASFEKIKE
ncbi:hypothetical protein GQF01_07215 [Paenibacillus sp. 5J-6]|uniref:Lipoprotein n=2 Tax=Paenibacillus silvestris TaxID=2606219 RepID=A0A6L8UUN3_9BACL|nr:hypothetical protein [Paenibacillus silvestris]